MRPPVYLSPFGSKVSLSHARLLQMMTLECLPQVIGVCEGERAGPICATSGCAARVILDLDLDVDMDFDGDVPTLMTLTIPGKLPPMAARLEKALPFRRERCRTFGARMLQNSEAPASRPGLPMSRAFGAGDAGIHQGI